ncbi:hypothetical protein [uncultured Litoreibacter sp.]|uniref:hypothetical protein n=1 Tax=uncultured Litoreibacter sp. TaxID=1392394 RepID=UPI0026150E3F|nr:hypothetical protein [uncultured Litoreibacter sp.]
MSGQHVEVWQEIAHSTDAADIEAVMRETYGRVARNTDTVIERLRDTGYRFETESGRYGEAQPPRRQISTHLGNAEAALEDRFGDLSTFVGGPRFLPLAFHYFALVVGVIDLRQRYPASEPKDELAEIRGRTVTPAERALMKAIQGALEGVQSKESELRQERRARAEAEDRRPHPSQDAVIARLGDWNPLVVDLNGLDDLSQEFEVEMVSLPSGGIGLQLDLAPSFEQKANVSGGIGAHVFLPNTRMDPMVFEDSRALPFIDYLRAAFTHGGFLGVPHPVRPNQHPLRSIDHDLRLPAHPIFTELTKGLETF